MEKTYTPEPKQRWKRKEFDPEKLKGLETRMIAEIETNRDLKKDVAQLLCDVHEETLLGERTEMQSLLHAQKRMVSMMARVAISNDKMSKCVFILTLLTLLVTIVNLFIVMEDVVYEWMISLLFFVFGSILTLILGLVWKVL